MAKSEWPTPGLKWRSRAGGHRVPYWFPSQAAVKAGYPGSAVNLSAVVGFPEELSRRCVELQTDMGLWMDGVRRSGRDYDGTVLSLLRLYQTHEQSPFHALKPGSRKPYVVYLRMLEKLIGDRRVVSIGGLDLKKWSEDWSVGDEGQPRVAAAAMMFRVLKAALTFACLCDIAEAFPLREKMSLVEIRGVRPRTMSATAKQVEAVRQAAHANGAPSRALAYALQFETALRQWDVTGQWYPQDYPLMSGILGHGRKWAGLMWAHIDETLVLRYRPSKTDKSSGAEITIDLNLCPMVLEEFASIPQEKRRGPVIVNESSGLPYMDQTFRSGWHMDRKAAGLPSTLWSRDLRASAITEARRANVSLEDAAKVAGHSNTDTTEGYDRAGLEASRRFQEARVAHRTAKERS